jgi:hypothetical protein
MDPRMGCASWGGSATPGEGTGGGKEKEEEQVMESGRGEEGTREVVRVGEDVRGRRLGVVIFVVLAVAVLVALAACGPRVPRGYEPRLGDVLFQSLPRQPLVEVIEGVSGSPFSHCGIVDEVDGEFVVLEALQRVRVVPLGDFLARGRDGAFAVYRWRAPWAEQVPAILAAARRYLGRPYDLRYRLDDDSIYCSELLWKAFRDATGGSLGQVQPLCELDWQPYEQAIRAMENGPVPLGREIITPIAVAGADPLEAVLYHGW